MSASAPEYIEDEDERELYKQLSSIFEDYCGTDPVKYPERTQSFVTVTNSIRDVLKDSNPTIDIEKRIN